MINLTSKISLSVLHVTLVYFHLVSLTILAMLYKCIHRFLYLIAPTAGAKEKGKIIAVDLLGTYPPDTNSQQRPSLTSDTHSSPVNSTSCRSPLRTNPQHDSRTVPSVESTPVHLSPSTSLQHDLHSTVVHTPNHPSSGLDQNILFPPIASTPIHLSPSSSAECGRNSHLVGCGTSVSPLNTNNPVYPLSCDDIPSSLPRESGPLFSSLTSSPEQSHPLLLELEVTDLTERVKQLEQSTVEVAKLWEVQTELVTTQSQILKRLARIEKAMHASLNYYRSKQRSCGVPSSCSSNTTLLGHPHTQMQQPRLSTATPESSSKQPEVCAPVLSSSSPQPPMPQSDESPMPLPYKLATSSTRVLPASNIDTSKLIPVNTVLSTYPKLQCESKIGTLAVKLATLSIFGESVMLQCTVAGTREYPALPTAELNELKEVIFRLCPRYWKSPPEFEAIWKTCMESIGQACKRLRSKKKAI